MNYFWRWRWGYDCICQCTFPKTYVNSICLLWSVWPCIIRMEKSNHLFRSDGRNNRIISDSFVFDTCLFFNQMSSTRGVLASPSLYLFMLRVLDKPYLLLLLVCMEIFVFVSIKVKNMRKSFCSSPAHAYSPNSVCVFGWRVPYLTACGQKDRE